MGVLRWHARDVVIVVVIVATFGLAGCLKLRLLGVGGTTPETSYEPGSATTFIETSSSIINHQPQISTSTLPVYSAQLQFIISLRVALVGSVYIASPRTLITILFGLAPASTSTARKRGAFWVTCYIRSRPARWRPRPPPQTSVSIQHFAGDQVQMCQAQCNIIDRDSFVPLPNLR